MENQNDLLISIDEKLSEILNFIYSIEKAIPVLIAIFVIYLFMKWFYRTFIKSAF